MANKISPVDREAIVGKFAGALEAGAAKETLAEIRAELRAQYQSLYSNAQVDAVCSQVIIQKNRKGKLHNEQPATSTASLSVPASLSHTRCDTKEERCINKGGAFADYENSPIKETWRLAVKKFIDKNSEMEKRATMRVLCTPGVKCHLEVRHLLELGYKPENIVAVEREKKVWNSFKENAQTLGINPVFGELRDIVLAQRKPFDVVNLDFVEAGSNENLLLFENLPLADRAIVIANFLAKREKTKFQEQMGRIHKTATGEIYDRIRKETIGPAIRKTISSQSGSTPLQIHQLANEALERTENLLRNDNDMSWEERDTMMWYMQRYTGTGRPEASIAPNFINNLSYSIENFDDPKIAELASDFQKKKFETSAAFKSLQAVLLTISMHLMTKFDDPRMLYMQKIPELLNCICFGRRQIIAMEKCRYNSKIGQTPSPFITSMAVTELPKKEYRKFQGMALFGLEFAKIFHATGEMPLRHEPEDARKELPGFFGGTRLTIMNGGRKMTSMNLEVFLNVLQEYFEEFIHKYPMSMWDAQKDIPWQRLEE